MMDFLYETANMRESLGSNFVGTARLEHGVETMIARFTSAHDDDGQDVELYCTPMPAQFFTIKALPTKNSIGEMKPEFSITTGSGMLEWSIATAELIREGMLSVKGTTQ